MVIMGIEKTQQAKATSRREVLKKAGVASSFIFPTITTYSIADIDRLHQQLMTVHHHHLKSHNNITLTVLRTKVKPHNSCRTGVTL